MYFDRNRRAYVLKSTACIEFVSVYSSTFLSPGPSLPVVVPAVFFRFPPFLVLFFLASRPARGTQTAQQTGAATSCVSSSMHVYTV